MSLMRKMFGKKRDKSPTLPTAIQKLHETECLLLKKQTYLESKIEKEVKIAKTNATKNKQGAIQALKRKKRYERQLQQIDGVLTTIEAQRETLENASSNAAMLSTMKTADDALKAAHKFMNVDQVDKMLSSIAEQKDVAGEISDAISHPVGWANEDVDEDELLKELEELNITDNDVEGLPDVPNGELDDLVDDGIKEKQKEKVLAS